MYSAPPGRPFHNNLPSSDPPEEIEDVTLFPRVSDWLQQLDTGSRGTDGHNFAQFIQFFQELKYVCICDIADNLTADSLITKCDNIAEGTAQKIVSYAKLDTRAIRRKEEKRARGSKAHYY